MQILGPLTIPNKVVVAPLAGISNAAFRTMMQRFNPGLIYTEMISDKALLHQNERTKKMAEIGIEEGRVSLQLFGDDIEALTYATRYIDEQTQAVSIDLNLGCPVPKVIKGNGGAALMRNPERVYTLVQTMVQNSSKPISVKIRTGWNDFEKNAVEVALAAQEAGASWLSIHGRTRAQMYQGSVDLTMIKAVKDALDIPVIGNGDIKTPEDALTMIEATGVDAVMIGRAVLSDPWILQKTKDYLATSQYTEPTLDERFAFMKDHAMTLRNLKGETLAVFELRSLLSWYVKGLPDSTQFKKTMVSEKDFNRVLDRVNDYQAYLKTQNKERVIQHSMETL